MDVDVELGRDNLSHIKEHSLAVDSSDFYSGIEEQQLVHVPPGVEDAVAEA